MTLKSTNQSPMFLLDQAPNPIVVRKPDHSIDYVNKAFEELTGFTAEEVVGTRAPYPWWTPEIFRKESGYFESLRNRQAKHIELLFQKKDGTPFWSEVSFTAVKNESGLVCYISNWVDITRRKQAQADVQKSEEKYRKLAEECPISIMIFDASGRVTFVNNWHLKTFAQNRVEADYFVGKKLLDLPGIAGSGIGEQLSEVFMGNDVILEDVCIQELPGGKPGYQTIKAVPFHSQGKVEGGILIREDVTVRNRKAEEIKIYADNLKKILNSTPNIIALVDNECRVEMVNHKGASFFEMDQSDFLGLSVGEEVFRCLPSFQGTEETINTKKIIPCPIKARVLSTLATGTPSSEEEAQLTFLINGKPKSGTFILTTSLLALNGIKKVLLSLTDVTERKRVEKENRCTTRLFQKIFDSHLDALFILDTEVPPRIVKSNKAARALFGYAENEMTGESIGKLHVNASCLKEFQDKLYSPVDKNGSMDEFELVMKRKNKTLFPVEHMAIELVDDAGERNGWVSIVRDLTERKKLESRTRQAQKMEAIGNLAGGIAHDFNNLLFPILGIAEMLLDDLSPGSVEYTNVLGILKAGRRGRELVKQILSFSRKTEHQMIPIRIQQVLDEVLQLSRSAIPSNIRIRQAIESGCGMVSADPVQLHQVAMNLISNAYQAVEETDGEISVELCEIELDKSELKGRDLKQGRYAVFSVRDNGIGISPSVMDKIFEPYFTTKEKGKGTGLGLAVVYGIVKEHKGYIKVQSNAGGGTAFHVYLPILEESVKTVIEHMCEPDQTGNEHILLVDDEEPVARLEKLMLERLCYTVDEKTSSVDALTTFRSSPDAYDLVVTDMSMPGMTGDRLAREMLAIRPDIPIIICTGFSERINDEAARTIGIREVLVKPVLKSELAGVIRRVLDTAKSPNL